MPTSSPASPTSSPRCTPGSSPPAPPCGAACWSCCLASAPTWALKRIAAALAEGSGQVDTEAELRNVRRAYVTRDNLRRAIARLASATLEARSAELWGPGTACASDSKKFGSWSSNLMTEWHARLRGPGVMIYWHVERRSVCGLLPAQHCSASEVAAMIE